MPRFIARERVLIVLQLEILDTAGAEQFTALNEVYISVRVTLHRIFPGYSPS